MENKKLSKILILLIGGFLFLFLNLIPSILIDEQYLPDNDVLARTISHSIGSNWVPSSRLGTSELKFFEIKNDPHINISIELSEKQPLLLLLWDFYTGNILIDLDWDHVNAYHPEDKYPTSYTDPKKFYFCSRGNPDSCQVWIIRRIEGLQIKEIRYDYGKIKKQ
jgi:hypothetical protein